MINSNLIRTQWKSASRVYYQCQITEHNSATATDDRRMFGFLGFLFADSRKCRLFDSRRYFTITGNTSLTDAGLTQQYVCKIRWKIISLNYVQYFESPRFKSRPIPSNSVFNDLPIRPRLWGSNVSNNSKAIVIGSPNPTTNSISILGTKFTSEMDGVIYLYFSDRLSNPQFCNRWFLLRKQCEGFKTNNVQNWVVSFADALRRGFCNFVCNLVLTRIQPDRRASHGNRC